MIAEKSLIAHVYDPKFRIEANKHGKNYWYEYIKEINEQLGLCAQEISASSLEDINLLSEISVLFIGNVPITDKAKSNIDAWVKKGGVLLSFATDGIDDISGNISNSLIPQPENDYTISGYFSLNLDPLTEEIHSYLHPEQKLLIFSDIRCITPKESKEIAHLYMTDQSDSGYSAITERKYAEGYAYYFAFDVSHTIWVLHQGIPITYDRDGDGYYRTGDLIAIGNNERGVLYADEILFLIQNMIARRPIPIIHQIPPKDGQVADALFYWGGDDEAAKGTQVWASNWMREKGLPYHINIMRNKDGEFTLSKDEVKSIQENGHECSLHYNFIDNFGTYEFTEADIKEQMDAFYSMYDFYPICTVNHWVRWTGWVETARWMLSAGGKADNSFIHHPLLPLNPANRLGFVFGTCFPFYFYDDYMHNNSKIDFLEEPITAYEVGYNSDGTNDFDIIHKVIDIAEKYHLTMNMFYHPINIYNYSACRKAIEEALAYIEKKGIKAVHKGNDGLWEWWSKRSLSQIKDVKIDENCIAFKAICEYKEGMVVKVPINCLDIPSPPTVDENPAVFRICKEFGINWIYIVTPEGHHNVSIAISKKG
ncbi:MAG: hypothetical protein ACUVWN_00830 [bacterium]